MGLIALGNASLVISFLYLLFSGISVCNFFVFVRPPFSLFLFVDQA